MKHDTLTPEQRKAVAAYVWSVRKALLALGRYRDHISELRGHADRAYILAASSPGEAKRRGRHVEIRHNWDEIKLGVMEQSCREKFSSDPLFHLLIATGEQELIEGNEWGDTFWGKCRGRGSNHLGKILMRIRAEVRS